jgi:transposase
VFPGKHWTKAHRGWLGELSFAHLAQLLVLEELLARIERAEELCDRLKTSIVELVPQWTLAPVVAAVQGLRGVSILVAATVVAEVGNFSRFQSPRQLMAYLGLNPSEHSSGATIKRGAITKTGNSLVRTCLVEAASTYRHPARVTKIIRDRLEGLPEPIRAIACKAQVQLSARYRKLIAAGQPAPKAIVAIARELVGFIWAIARLVEPKAAVVDARKAAAMDAPKAAGPPHGSTEKGINTEKRRQHDCQDIGAQSGRQGKRGRGSPRSIGFERVLRSHSVPTP